MKTLKSIMAALSIAVIAATAAPCAMAAESSIIYGEELNMNQATIQPVDESFGSSNINSKFGRISVKLALTDGAVSYKLFPTFDNPDQALSGILNQAPQMLSFLKTEFSLDPISSENWSDYRDAMYEEFDREDCPTWFFEEEDEYMALLQFFDIYENEGDNAAICSAFAASKITTLTDCPDTTSIPSSQDVLAMLPNQEVLNGERYDAEIHQPSTLSTNGFDPDKGVAYANDHATNPNESGYGYIAGADCTNFVSQILEKGGVAQDVYTSINKGWWHKKIVAEGGPYHTRSKSWTAADVFVNYMGVGYKTTSNASFSSHIKKGDFIAADWTSDGRWDHMGFCMLRKSEKSNGYYNYKVAQHTKDYIAWTSSATNNWENAGKDGGTYARVRR